MFSFPQIERSQINLKLWKLQLIYASSKPLSDCSTLDWFTWFTCFHYCQIMEPNKILVMMIFGAIGMGYIVYGKNHSHGIALLAGIGLCVYPYFVTGMGLLLLIGAVLTVGPFLLKPN